MASEPANKKYKSNSECSQLELKDWLASLHQENLLSSNINVHSTEEAGLGLFAAKDIIDGETIATIPYQAILTPDKIMESSIGKFLEAFPCHFRAYAFLASSRYENDNPLHIWLSTLPQYACNVSWWPQEERDLLQGTNLGYAIDKSRKELEDFYEKVKVMDGFEEVFKGVTLDDLQWAAGVYDSRRFPMRLGTPGSQGKKAEDDLGEATGEGVMIPLLDFGNHSSSSTITWTSDDIGVNFQCGDKKDIRKGQEIFNNYGLKGNEELLMAYGFALKGNPHDVYSLLLSVGNAPPPAPTKKIGPFHIRYPPTEGDDSQNEEAEVDPQFPVQLWRALSNPLAFAQKRVDVEEEEVQIDLEDIEYFLHHLASHAQKLDKIIARNKGMLVECKGGSNDNEKGPSSLDGATRVRRRDYIGWYLEGQVNVLQAAQQTLNDMLEGVVEEEEVDEEERN